MNRYLLFNFSASYIGGGFKRLFEYAKFFNDSGGAVFLIHPKCHSLELEFPKNKYYFSTQSKLKRLMNDFSNVENILEDLGEPYAYYSYGIPLTKKFGEINIFHISNILPFRFTEFQLSFFMNLKMNLLRSRILISFSHADIISAESKSSFENVDLKWKHKFFVSPNGNDEEIENNCETEFENSAIVVGTYFYKNINASIRIYRHLQRIEKNKLNLKIIGDKKNLSKEILKESKIEFLGMLEHKRVLDILKKSKYYISTTLIENSFNAASEGIFLSQESFISDIPPHLELLENESYSYFELPEDNIRVIYVKREDLIKINLKTWSQIIHNFLDYIENFK